MATKRENQEHYATRPSTNEVEERQPIFKQVNMLPINGRVNNTITIGVKTQKCRLLHN